MEGLKKILLFITYEDRIVKCVLPGVNDRKVKLPLFEQTGIRELELSLEVWDEAWFICSTPEIRISRNHQIIGEEKIEAGYIYNGKIYATNFRFQVRVTHLGEEQTSYAKYDLQGKTSIRIGSHEKCHIVLHNPYVSNCHAVLFQQNGRWYIEDRSTNGTYVNGKKIAGTQQLSHGARILIMDYQLFFLGSIVAVNNITTVQSALQPVQKAVLTQKYRCPERESFSRAPRFVEPLDEEIIEIEGPPALQRSRKMPLYLTIGPSLTMPVPILLMVVFNIALSQSSGGSVNPFSYLGMAISVIMFSALGVMWTMLRKNYEETSETETAENREKAYKSYIIRNEAYISEKEKLNRRILTHIYLSTEEILGSLSRSTDMLWNRNVNHEDFLTIRIGSGPLRIPNEIKIPKQRFSVEDDPLVSLPGKLSEKHAFMEQMPKILPLSRYKIIGVTGDASFLWHMSHSMIVQTAALHSYQDVKMVFLMKPGKWEDEWRWVKWLPHVFDSEKKIRYIANSEETWENVQQELLNEIKFREEMQQAEEKKGGGAGYKQYYLIFVSDRERFGNSLLYQYMVSDQDVGFIFILLYGHLSQLPNECRFILEKTKVFQGAYQLNEAIGKNNTIRFEELHKGQAERFARKLNRYVLQEMGQSALPESVDYFSMIGIGRIEQWDLMKHYKENRSYEGIRAWIGMMPGGRPMFLDIHEKKHGPHGLIAGTTGSGKSELIQTFILSLALNYHPSEVAFILIDYKGGGMAKIFEGIPHIAGMILDLEEEDGTVNRSQTRRTFLSIRSEIKRREKIFNQHHVNHIDDYMRLYREKKASEPLPHLIIISDEFAELKKEQPEFIKELVSTARVGRSLGVHLILATQKPAGVVDDQIFSNARFKICLRVQDKSDSNEMLKRPEAAFLSTTGRAYFQLGNNELFEIFQSGYSGADYEAKDSVSSADDEDAVMICLDGTPAAVPYKKKEEGSAPNQIRTAMAYIKETAKKNRILPVKPLWLPPLPAMLSLNMLERYMKKERENTVAATVGLIDDPERQRQYPLELDFGDFSNLMIIGNQGSGKSTLIQTVLYDLVSQYSASRIHFYVFDFSGGLLNHFKYVPHCGGVASLEDKDTIERTIRYLHKTMEERDRLFKASNVGSYWEYCKVSSRKIPLILLVVDNYFAMAESYEKMEPDMIRLLRGGQRAGIQFIVSVNRMSDMKFRLRQNFSRVLALQLNEKMDYSEALGGYLDGFSTQIKGRGLCREEGIFEFQTALAVEKKTEFERVQILTEKFKQMSAGDSRAKQIRALPRDESYEEFIAKQPEDMLREGIPLGYEQEEIVPYYIRFDQFFCYLVSGACDKAVHNVLYNICTYLNTGRGDVYSVCFGKDRLPGVKKAVYGSEEGIFHMLLLLKEEFTKRNQWRKKYPEGRSAKTFAADLQKEFRPMFFIIEDFGAFLECIYGNHGAEAYYPITELFFKEGAGLGIWFIAGMEAGKSASAPYSLAYKYFTQAHRGIHMGGQLNMQKLFQFDLPVSAQTARWDDHLGCFMEEDETCRVYVPWSRKRQ